MEQTKAEQIQEQDLQDQEDADSTRPERGSESEEQSKEVAIVPKELEIAVGQFIKKKLNGIPIELKVAIERGEVSNQEAFARVFSQELNGASDSSSSSKASNGKKKSKKKKNKKPEWKVQANALIKQGAQILKSGNLPWGLQINFKAFLLFKQNKSEMTYDLKQNLRKALSLESMRQYNECKFEKAAQASYLILEEIDEEDVNAQYMYGISIMEESMWAEAAQKLQLVQNYIGKKLLMAKQKAKESPKRVIKFMKQEIVEYEMK